MKPVILLIFFVMQKKHEQKLFHGFQISRYLPTYLHEKKLHTRSFNINATTVNSEFGKG